MNVGVQMASSLLFSLRSQFIECCHHIRVSPPTSTNPIWQLSHGYAWDLSPRCFWMLSSWKAILTIIILYRVPFRFYVCTRWRTLEEHLSVQHLVCSYHAIQIQWYQTHKYNDKVRKDTVRVLIPMRKHHYQKQFGRERAYLILSLVVHHPEKSQQEPGNGNICRSHGGALLTGLFLVSGLACFLIVSSCPGGPLPIMCWALQHQSLIEKMHYRFSYRPMLWNYFLN